MFKRNPPEWLRRFAIGVAGLTSLIAVSIGLSFVIGGIFQLPQAVSDTAGFGLILLAGLFAHVGRNLRVN